MKLIHNFKSPNYNNRKSKSIDLVIIHYTALKSVSESIKYLCAKKNKVSSHYLISKKGAIFSLVSEKKRAWHAGKSYWKGKTDINSISIGIELDYLPGQINKKYPKTLINVLCELLKKLIKKYKITPDNILGHSDIAPYRKIDPGKNFPWELLENQKLAYKINKIYNQNLIFKLLNDWFDKNNINTNKKKILFMLNYIGYDVSLAFKSNIFFEQIKLLYANRFEDFQKNRSNKKNVITVIKLHFLNIILTKEKK